MLSGKHDVSTVGAIADLIANRSLSSLLAFFAALNLLPLPPGTSVILGIPIVVIACQLIFVQRRIWLPRFIAQREVSKETLTRLIGRIMPWTLRLEHFLRPRYWPFRRYRGDTITGILGLLLGIVVVFPIPLGNAPPAFAIFIVGLANAQKDGIWFAIGILVGLISIAIASAVVGGAAYLINSIF